MIINAIMVELERLGDHEGWGKCFCEPRTLIAEQFVEELWLEARRLGIREITWPLVDSLHAVEKEEQR